MHPDYINDRVRSVIQGRNFFDDLKILAFILNPIRETVLALEGREVTLEDCFFYLARLGAAIKKLPKRYNVSFYNHCIKKMNSRFEEFDDDKYLLAFFLTPYFRGILCTLFISYYKLQFITLECCFIVLNLTLCFNRTALRLIHHRNS